MVVAAAAAAAGKATAADLTPTEQRWLQGAWPVVQFARQQALPLDIVVQPQPAPELPPLAMAFVEGRCKLVLSMRGNPQAAATLGRIDPALLQPALELMAAHELGHCRRHLDGHWHDGGTGQPAAFAAGRTQAWADMQATRREEGFADLVGLAWVQQRHPGQYAQLHAWLLAERLHDTPADSHHDTVAWLRHVPAGVMPPDQAAGPPQAAALFGAADRVWRATLPTLPPLP